MKYKYTHRLMVDTHANFLDFLIFYVSAIGIIICILLGNYVSAVVLLLIGMDSFNHVLTGKKKVMVNPIYFDDINLYEVKRENEESVYVIANSIEEVNAYCELHELSGNVFYIGKAKYFTE